MMSSTEKSRKGRKGKGVVGVVAGNDATVGTAMLPEQVNDDLTPEQRAEINEATRRHQAEEASTASALALNDKTNGAGNGTNGQSDTKEEAAVVPKKEYLTKEAHEQRAKDVRNPKLRPYAAWTAVEKYFDGLVAAGRSTTQLLTLGEYRTYLLEAQRSPASKSERAPMYTSAAFAIVRFLFGAAKELLRKKFDGQSGVDVTDEFLHAVAEAKIATDDRFSLAIDGGIENCGGSQVNKNCERRFIPLRGLVSTKDGIKQFGSFRRVGTKIVAFCTSCVLKAKADADNEGKPRPNFVPCELAERFVESEKDRRNTSKGLRNAMGMSDDFRRERDQRGGRQHGNQSVERLTDEKYRHASHNVHELLDSNSWISGATFAWRDFDWKDRNGGTIKGMIFLQVDPRPVARGEGRSIKLMDASPCFSSVIGKTWFEGKIPGFIMVAARKGHEQMGND